MSEQNEQTPAPEKTDPTEIEIEHLDSQPDETKPAAEGQPVERVEKPEPEPPPDWEDRYLRLAAEFDNYRKRSARDFARIIKAAEGELILELTEVLDNLERALNPENRNSGLDELVKGIELTREQFKSVLEKRGLTRMKSIGEPFDPEKHEALMQMDSDDIPEGYVIGEVAVGYELGDKVLRHARVIVSRGPAKKEGEETERE
jgi:molecular chaperone GrpE